MTNLNKRICPKCSTPWYSADTMDIWKCEDCGSEIPVPEYQGEMSFPLYCVEIANVPFYNFLCREEKEHLREQHEEYCEKNNLSPY